MSFSNANRDLEIGRQIVLLGFFSVMLLAGGCERSEQAQPQIKRVVLISLDTTRADYLGCYGYPEPTTPNIDALAKRGVLFERAYSPVPLTLPAHTTMLTGRIPPSHGVHDNIGARIPASETTLAEHLKGRGFQAAAFISALVLDGKFGMRQGFDTYDDTFVETHELVGNISERRGSETTDEALHWLQTHYEQPFFLFVHYYDPHANYRPPEPFKSRFPGKPYAGEIAYADHCVGRLVSELERLDIFDETLIIVTGDHGEMLGEHGEIDHGYFIYESALRVPLIIVSPTVGEMRRVEHAVGLVDIVPTVCGLLGIEPPLDLDGHDLSEILNGREKDDPERLLYCECLTATKYGASPLIGLTSQRWKYIQTTRPELYDLSRDPREANNLAARRSEEVAFFRQALTERTADFERQDSELAITAEDQRRLASLGYIASTTVEGDLSLSFEQGLEDPKDLIEFHKRQGKLAYLMSAKRFSEAQALAAELADERPSFIANRLDLARIAMAQYDHERALEAARMALQMDPDNADAHTALGAALLKLGQDDHARQAFEQAVRYSVAPENAWVTSMLGIGRVFELHKRTQQAIECYQAVLVEDPKRDDALARLGILYQTMGDSEQARLYLEQTLALNPENAEAHHNLGSILAKRGQLEAAMAQYRAALVEDPNYPEAHHHLGLALAVRGDFRQSAEHFRRAGLLKRDWREPLNTAAWILAAHPEADIRQPIEAVRLAEMALRADDPTVQTAEVLDTLAVALAAAGRFDEAVQRAAEGVRAAQVTGQEALARSIAQRKASFEAGQCYIDYNLSVHMKR